MRRLLLWFSWLVTLLMLVTLAALLLVSTQAGSRWLIRVAASAVAGTMSVESSRGTLLSTLDLEAVRYQLDELHIELDTFTLSWDPRRLLDGVLHISTFTADGLRIRLPSPDNNSTENNIPPDIVIDLPETIELPLQFAIDAALVTRVTIESGTQTWPLDNIELSTHSNGNAIQVTQLKADTPTASISSRGRIATLSPFPLSVRLDWFALLPDELTGSDLPRDREASGSATLIGSLQHLRIKHELEAPWPISLDAVVKLEEKRPHLDLKGHWDSLTWPPGDNAFIHSRSGDLRINGTLQDYRLSLSFAADGSDIPQLATSVRGRGDLSGFQIEDWLVNTLGGELRVRGATKWQPDIEWTADITARDINPGLQWPQAPGKLESTISLRGSFDETLQLLARIDNLQGTLLGQDISGQATIQVDDNKMSAELAANALEFNASLNGSAQLTAQLPFNVDITWMRPLPETAGNELTARGIANVFGNLETVRFMHTLESPVDVRTNASIDLTGETVRFEMDGEWEPLTWPLTGGSQYRIDQGQYTLTGTPDDYTAVIATAVAGKQIPATRLALQAAGNQAGMDINDLVLSTLDGVINVGGHVDWAPDLRWNLKIAANRINPGMKWPDIPGRLRADLEVSGVVQNNRLSIDSQINRLQGELRGQPVAATGLLNFGGGKLRAKALEVRSGDNRLALEGTVDKRLDLAFKLEAPALAQLWPGLRGKASAEGTLGGSTSDPSINADARADSVRYQGNRLGSLKAKIAIDPANAEASNSNIELRDLQLDDHNVMSIKLSAKGNTENHQVRAEALSEYGNATINTSGAWINQQWNGTVNTLVLTPSGVGRWDLAAPAAISVGATTFNIEAFCLGQKSASFCGSAQWQTSSGITATGKVTQLPLEIARQSFPDDLELNGMVDGHFSLAHEQGAVKGNINVAMDNGQLRYQPPDAEPIEVNFSEAEMSALYENQQLNSSLSMRVMKEGRIEGKLQVGSPADGQPLDGRLLAELPSVAIVAALAPQLSELQGAVMVTANVDGKLAEPRVSGEALLKNGGVQIPDAGLTLQEIDLRAASEGLERVILTGSAMSGEGKLNLIGEVLLSAEQGWPLNLNIAGEDFEVVNLPEVRAIASPALNIQASTQRVDIRGAVVVPAADITIKEIPQGAVAISDDEVIIGTRGEEQKRGTTRVGATVDITLGDKVRFEGFGLTSGLSGKIRLNKQPGQVTDAQGNLDMVDGHYAAYGQNLRIDPGRFVFAGPVAQPFVDIRASRKTGNVVAGIHVEGTVSKPQTSIFSDPPMSEAEALSYALTGRPLSSATSDEGAALSQAAVTLGLRRSLPIIQQIGNKIGLDEISIDTQGDVEESALTVGKYLSPDLYVGYVYGLFDRIGGVLLRYQLSESVSVEAQSGLTQSLDLIYSLERD